MELAGLFSGVTVLELASVLAGPAVGQFFAELGARVIKIEDHRRGGDVTRSWKTRKEKGGDISAYYSSVNWGKKSVGVNLADPEGQELVYAMVRQSDFIITSFKPGGAERLGMDYERIRAENPAIIYGAITGYGKDDPRVGYDAVIQAESGFMSMNAQPGGDPMKMPVALIDILAAHQLKEAMLLAHINRLKTGQGMEVSVSLFDAAVASLANQATNYLQAGIVPAPKGSLHPNIAPYGEVLECKDGKRVLLAIGNDAQFNKLCAILAIPRMATDPRFSTNPDRLANRPALAEVLGAACRDVSSGDFLEACRQQGVPVGEIRSVDEVLSLPSVRLYEDQGIRGLPSFVGMDGGEMSAPPHLGEHTQEIISQLPGIQASRITELQLRGIIG